MLLYRFEVICIMPIQNLFLLVHRAEFPQSVTEFEHKVDYKRAEVSVFELCKNQASLSSLCLLIKKNRPHHTTV